MFKSSAAEDGMNPLEKGRRLYQQEDYHAAIQAFSDAIKLSTGSLLLTALDHRASTYEKIGELQTALRDSKKMLDVEPNLAKGYIRCGKILQAKGQDDVAMSIYERGLRKVKIGTDKNWTLLQSAFNKLRAARNTGRCLDPLAYLPFEIAEMVMQRLEMRDLVICLAVTKSWKSLLDSSPALWNTFDTRATGRAISLHSLKTHLRRSKYKLHTAMISSNAKFDVSKMKYLTGTCKQLKHLEMHHVGIIGESLIASLPLARNISRLIIGKNCLISPKGMVLALEACHKTLVEAKFLAVLGIVCNHKDPWPKLEYLECFDLRVRDKCRNFFDMEAVVSESMPNIKSLTLIGCDGEDTFPGRLDLTGCLQLEFLHISNGWVFEIPSLPPTVKYIDFSSGDTSMSQNFVYVEDNNIVVFDLPLLESFDCRGTSLKNRTLKNITLKSIQAGNLKKLFIGRQLMDDGVASINAEYPASDTVTVLHMGSPDMSEDRIMEVVRQYPNLRSLDVSTSRVTGVAVKAFVLGGITTLRCNECYNISPDAIEYARSHGVDVEARLGSNTRGRPSTFRDSVFTFGPN